MQGDDKRSNGHHTNQDDGAATRQTRPRSGAKVVVRLSIARGAVPYRGIAGRGGLTIAHRRRVASRHRMSIYDRSGVGVADWVVAAVVASALVGRITGAN